MIIIKVEPKLSKTKEKRLAKMLQQIIDSSIYDHSNYNFYYDNDITYNEKGDDGIIKMIPAINVEYKEEKKNG